MAVASKVSNLPARKRLLVAESELHRQALAMQIAAINERTTTLQQWAFLGWKAYPVIRGGMTLGRSLFAGRRGASSGPVSKISMIARVARIALEIASRVKGSPKTTSPSEDGH